MYSKILMAFLLSLGFCFSFSLGLENCTKITSSGNIFISQPLTGVNPAATGACIEITASDVTLDCNQQTIKNNGANDAVGIWIHDADRVTIKNCDISGYGKTSKSFGIAIEDSNGNRIENTKVHGNSRGILFSTSNSNTVIGNTVYDNTEYNLFFFDSSKSTVSGNTAYGSGKNGFRFFQSQSNTLKNNIARDNEVGFLLESSSNSNTLTDNKAYGNSAQGFGISESSSNEFRNNMAHDNDWGFVFVSSDENTMQSNVIYDNKYGTYVHGSKLSTSNDRHYSNDVYDLAVDGYNGRSSTISANKITFDNGNSDNSVKLSLSDTSSTAYGIKWTSNPSTPSGYSNVPHNSVKISNANGDIFSIDTLKWDWSDFDTSNYKEANFVLLRYEDPSWRSTGASLSTDSNTLTMSGLSVAGTYSIFQKTEPLKSLRIAYLLACDKTTFTVTDDKGNLVSDATVSFDNYNDVYTYKTDVNGQAVVPMCGKRFVVRATKTDYGSVSFAPDQFECAKCTIKCSADSDCPATNKCVASQCSAISCPSGIIVNHMCVECAKDSDCKNSMVCSQNKCSPPAAKCSKSSDCAIDELCQNSACTKSQINYGISTPSSATVGDTVSLGFKKNDESCINCQIQITDPSGSRITPSTDGSGNYVLYLANSGMYQVSILKEDTPLSTATFNVNAKSNGGPTNNGGNPQNPVFGGLDSTFIWIGGGILIIVVVGVLYMMSKKP